MKRFIAFSHIHFMSIELKNVFKDWICKTFFTVLAKKLFCNVSGNNVNNYITATLISQIKIFLIKFVYKSLLLTCKRVI